MRYKLLAIIAAAMLATACTDEESSGGYPVYFKCGDEYPVSITHGSGQFIQIERDGASAYKLTYYEGDVRREKRVQRTAAEIREGALRYGLGGLIVGTPSAYDGERWAFDLACPKCELASRKLTIDLDEGFAHAHCTKCASKFDLNSGGIPIEGDSRRAMFRYKVYRDGTFMVIIN